MLLPDARCGALENKTLKLHYSIKNKWHSTINNKFYPSLYSIYIILNYAKNTQEEKEVVWNGLNSKLAVAPRRDMFTQCLPHLFDGFVFIPLLWADCDQRTVYIYHNSLHTFLTLCCHPVDTRIITWVL